MKNKLFLLLKTTLKNTGGINKIFKSSKKKKVLYVLLFVYIAISILASIATYSVLLIDGLKKISLLPLFLPILLVFTLFSSFVFTMFTAKNILFEAKDNDLLLSLPIKTKLILAVRLLSLFIINFAVSFIILIPASIVFLLKEGFSLFFLINAIIVFLFSAFIPTILSALLGYLVAFLSSKVKVKGLFEIIFSLLIMALFFYVPNKIGEWFTTFNLSPESIINIFKYAFFPIYLVIKAIISRNIIYTLGFAFISVLIFYIFICIFQFSYFKIYSKLSIQITKNNFKMKKYKTSSQMKTLFIKEIKRYLSSPIYIFNTAFGVIILILMGILCIADSKKFFEILSSYGSEPFQLLVMLYCFVVALTSTTSSSISLEGNSFWIIKSLPVSVQKIFNAKKLLNYLLVVPTIIISLFLFKIGLNISIKEIGLIFVISILISVFTINFGLLANLLFPKFEFNNDAEIVKRSMSTFIGIFGPLMLFIIALIIYVTVIPNLEIIIIFGSIIMVILDVILLIIINTWGVRKFNQL